MVDEEKLMEWIQEKLEQGVDEQRIRKSLKETGHDPALLEKAKDPFHRKTQDSDSDSDGPENLDQMENSDDRQPEPQKYGKDKKPQRSKDKSQDQRKDPRDQIEEPENAFSQQQSDQQQDNSQRRSERNQREKEGGQRKDDRSGPRDDRRREKGRNPSIDLSSDLGPENSHQGSQNNASQQPSQNRQQRNQNSDGQRPRRNQQRTQQKSQDSEGSRLSLPSFSMPSVSLPSISLSMPSVPWKHVAVVVLVLGVLGGSYAAYSTGLLQDMSVPDVPFDQQTESPENVNSEQQGPSCEDVGVRIENIDASGPGTDVEVRLFGSEIRAVVELYSEGSVVASEQFDISGTETVSFNRQGDEVRFRPYGCETPVDTQSVN